MCFLAEIIMKVIIPINGKNERVGKLFKTPKHLLLYKGIPALYYNLQYFNKMNYVDEVVILTNNSYINELFDFLHLATIVDVGKTSSQVETLRRYTENIPYADIMFVDCDIIIKDIVQPDFNTVFVFENKNKDKQYSNYKVSFEHGNYVITDCNEKENYEKYAGSGVYYFQNIADFSEYSKSCTSISHVVKNMINAGKKFIIDKDNDIYRFGTLKDILS
jgi:hypothetical protein